MASQPLFPQKNPRVIDFRRWLPILYWGILLLFLVIFIKNNYLEDLVDNFENVLLDMRLRARAQLFTPSKDIVLIATDEETESYALNHPELGINSRTLPRRYLAKLVNYVSKRGAKAILIDGELVTPSTEEDDTQLIKAMQEAGNVYTALAFDSPFSRLVEKEKNKSTRFVQEVIKNTLKRQSQVDSYLYGHSPDGFYADLSGFFLWGSHSINEKPTSINSIMEISRPKLIAKINSLSQDNPTTLENYLSYLCLSQNYQDLFRANPDFLNFLVQDQIPVSLLKPPHRIPINEVTFCSTRGIYHKFLPGIKHLGIVWVDYGQDTTIRDIPVLYKTYEGVYHTYLGIRPALDLLGVQNLEYTPTFLKLDDKKIPLIEDRKLLLNWRNPHLSTNGHLYRKISAIDIIRKMEADSQEAEADYGTLHNTPHQPNSGFFSFKNKIVIYGDTVKDIHRTPISATLYGPEVVANTLDMVLHDTQFIQKIFDWRIYLPIGFLCLTILAIIIADKRLLRGFLCGFLIIVLYGVFNIVVFTTQGYWFPLMLPTAILFSVLMGGTFYKYYVHDKEKRLLTSVFSNYVAPQILDEILTNPQKAMDNLKGRKKELTVLFADIQGFTQTFEHEDPELMVEQLNEYLDTMVNIILEHGGTIDKYMGDAVMAFFGAPHPMSDHASKACKTAIAMQKALQDLNQKWEVEGKKVLTQGIGVSSGLMFVGNFGSERIKDFTVMGSIVNLGARLESYTREAHVPIIISAKTLEMLEGKAHVRDLGEISVKGFTSPVRVFSLDAL